MVPPPNALLALLTLKLLDKERRSHINDFNFDEALGLFAGLNILPKKSYATDYSYRTTRENQRALLAGWVRALSRMLFPEANTFSLDFHPIPYRGDPAGLDRHYLPAIAALESGIAIIRKLAEINPTVTGPRKSLVDSQLRLGWVFQMLGRTPEALDAFTRSTELSEGLVADEPGSATSQNLLAQCFTQYGNLLLLSAGQPRRSRSSAGPWRSRKR